ncbi:bifunctional RNase H/acid phosphatase [Isoptericola variabilis]|uniref:Phosphoglycerate mutase n=1 Tax=Isoptericola variabilis (strain 225) TaxID=743718 RepID=F6FX23_ISOV2|nr:bifunctional RNase H/acid phosphatase [Isoptericola variabilis]AEG44623.1 Phosphoglycerate mutase [Isoptericola variabilis 225]TWH28075.1 putative phosphoglycerate mutase [Isoptericola variabilis J7]
MAGGRRLVVEADGGSRGNPGPAGWGALVRDADSGAVLAERAGYLGESTNNVAEYSGLVAGLRAAREVDPDAHVLVRMDSRLVVEQMTGRWQIKHAALRELAREAASVLPADQVAYEWVPRSENAAADRLANEAMDTGSQIARDFPAEESTSGPATAAEDEAPGFDTHVRPSGALVGYDGATALSVVLVRHGETHLTVAGAYSGGGVPGPALTTRGRTQAAQAADAVFRVGRDLWPDLPRVTDLVASPTVRTQETAAAVGRRIGQHVRTEQRFAECVFGEWEGLTALEIEERAPGELALWHSTGTFAPPGGESYAQLGARVWSGLEDLLDGGVGRTVAVVGHAAMIRTAVGQAIGAPPSHWSRLRIPPCSLTVLRLWADGASEVTTVGFPTDA